MLPIDAIGDDQPERNLGGAGFFDQRPGQVRFGVKRRIRLAFGQSACGSVGLDAYRDMPRAIGPLAGDRDHPIGHMA
jgi:hypothetical protein